MSADEKVLRHSSLNGTYFRLDNHKIKLEIKYVSH
jgi:hypothetical protein